MFLLRPCFVLLCLSTLAACGSGSSAEEEKNSSSEMENPFDLNRQLYERGIDFIARGNASEWTLEMDFDQSFRFATADGLAFQTPPVEPSIAMDAPVRRYRAVTEKGEMTITLQEGACTEASTGEAFSHEVRIDLQIGTTDDPVNFSGCGRYVVPMRLHDIWVLESWKGGAVDTAGMPKGKPTLEIHSGIRRVSGHTGCNNFTGTFDIMGEGAIQFSPLASTRMACPAMDLEDDIQRALSGRRLDFRFNGLSLILGTQGEELATFRKVD